MSPSLTQSIDPLRPDGVSDYERQQAVDYPDDEGINYITAVTTTDEYGNEIDVTDQFIDVTKIPVTQAMPARFVAHADPDPMAPAMCDVAAALETLQRRTELLNSGNVELIEAVNILGQQVQWLTDGTMNLFKLLNSVGQDLANMSITDKVKLIKGMMG